MDGNDLTSLPFTFALSREDCIGGIVNFATVNKDVIFKIINTVLRGKPEVS